MIVWMILYSFTTYDLTQIVEGDEEYHFFWSSNLSNHLSVAPLLLGGVTILKDWRTQEFAYFALRHANRHFVNLSRRTCDDAAAHHQNSYNEWDV